MEQSCGWAGSDILKKYHDEEWGCLFTMIGRYLKL